LFLQAWTTKTDEKAESELDGACAAAAGFFVKAQKFRAVKTPSFHGYVLQQQQRILLHPTRHHIAQKYMLSVATWRREWAERVTYTWSAKHTDLHQHTA